MRDVMGVFGVFCLLVLVAIAVWEFGTGGIARWADRRHRHVLRQTIRERDEARDEIAVERQERRRLQLLHEPEQTVWIDGEEITVEDARLVEARPRRVLGRPIRSSKGRPRHGR